MKNKKIITILSIVCIIIALSGIGIYAGISYKNNCYERKNDIPKSKELNVYDDNKISTDILNSKIKIAKNKSELKYKESINYDEKLSVNIYTDENGNEYKYDKKGMLKGFSAQLELAQDEIAAFTGKPITKNEAVSFAKEYAKVLYGDLTNGYELFNISQLQDGTYSLSLVKKFGDEKFIIGPKLTMKILPNGNLSYSTIVNYDLYDDFDFSKLDGITEKEVLEYFEKEIYKEFEQGTEYEYSGIYLSKIENEFKIHAVVFVEGGDEFFPVTFDREYYYELG